MRTKGIELAKLCQKGSINDIEDVLSDNERGQVLLDCFIHTNAFGKMQLFRLLNKALCSETQSAKICKNLEMVALTDKERCRAIYDHLIGDFKKSVQWQYTNATREFMLQLNNLQPFVIDAIAIWWICNGEVDVKGNHVGRVSSLKELENILKKHMRL